MEICPVKEVTAVKECFTYSFKTAQIMPMAVFIMRFLNMKLQKRSQAALDPLDINVVVGSRH